MPSASKSWSARSAESRQRNIDQRRERRRQQSLDVDHLAKLAAERREYEAGRRLTRLEIRERAIIRCGSCGNWKEHADRACSACGPKESA